MSCVSRRPAVCAELCLLLPSFERLCGNIIFIPGSSHAHRIPPNDFNIFTELHNHNPKLDLKTPSSSKEILLPLAVTSFPPDPRCPLINLPLAMFQAFHTSQDLYNMVSVGWLVWLEPSQCPKYRCLIPGYCQFTLQRMDGF